VRDGWEGKSTGPPWTPDVWQVGPDALVARATHDLFADQHTIDGSLRTGAGDGYADAMTGGRTAPMNETDQLINSTHPGPTSGVKGEWDKAMRSLRKTDPLAEGPVNPAP
jgi:hypothetical protein